MSLPLPLLLLLPMLISSPCRPVAFPSPPRPPPAKPPPRPPKRKWSLLAPNLLPLDLSSRALAELRLSNSWQSTNSSSPLLPQQSTAAIAFPLDAAAADDGGVGDTFSGSRAGDADIGEDRGDKSNAGLTDPAPLPPAQEPRIARLSLLLLLSAGGMGDFGGDRGGDGGGDHPPPKSSP